jgi:hypothetical protein
MKIKPSTEPSLKDEKRSAELYLRARRLERQNGIIAEGLKNLTLLNAKDCARLAGYAGKNPARFLAGKRKQQKIFGISHESTSYFPSFQFVEIGPGMFKLFSDMPKLLKPLSHAELNEWDIFFWFDSPNRLLQGKKPRDLLPLPGLGEEVVCAAQKIAEKGAY